MADEKVFMTSRWNRVAALSGVVFVALVAVFGVFFYGYVRAYFGQKPGNEWWLSAVFFAGAVIIVGLGASLSSGINVTLTDSPPSFSASSMQLLNTMSQDVNWATVCVGKGVLHLSAGLVVYRSRVLPLGLARVSWIFGLCAASYALSWISLFGTAVWVLVVSIMLAVRNPGIEWAPAAPPRWGSPGRRA